MFFLYFPGASCTHFCFNLMCENSTKWAMGSTSWFYDMNYSTKICMDTQKDTFDSSNNTYGLGSPVVYSWCHRTVWQIVHQVSWLTKGCLSLFDYFIDRSPTIMSPFFVKIAEIISMYYQIRPGLTIQLKTHRFFKVFYT